MIKVVNELEEPVVFILWGSYAREKKPLITPRSTFGPWISSPKSLIGLPRILWFPNPFQNNQFWKRRGRADWLVKIGKNATISNDLLHWQWEKNFSCCIAIKKPNDVHEGNGSIGGKLERGSPQECAGRVKFLRRPALEPSQFWKVITFRSFTQIWTVHLCLQGNRFWGELIEV